MRKYEKINKDIEKSYNHVQHLELPTHLKNLNKKDLILNIESQINKLKKKGWWKDDNFSR